jgi:uncharacterized protein with beta-barrel porin domain
MKKKWNSMKKKKWRNAGGLLVLAIAIAAGCWYGLDQQSQKDVPELTSFVDTEEGTIAEIQEDEVPLGDTKVTTKTTKKTSKKTVKLKKAAKKTYKVTKPSTTKKTSNTTTKNGQKVKVDKTIVTSVVESFKKKSKTKTVTTTVKTTTKTTTTATSGTGSVTGSLTSTTNSSTSTGVQTLDVATAASNADANVIKAFQTLGFSIKVDSSVSYSGYFDAKTQKITLKKNDNTIYHELGHFLAFMAGNADTKSDFKAIYESEKDQFTGVNKAYVTQDSSEYFAESYKDYVLDASALKSSRPQTYEAIVAALAKVTDKQIEKIKEVYGPVWGID